MKLTDEQKAYQKKRFAKTNQDCQDAITALLRMYGAPVTTFITPNEMSVIDAAFQVISKLKSQTTAFYCDEHIKELEA